MMKTGLFALALVASTPFAHAWFGGSYTPPPPPPPPAQAHCHDFSNLWTSGYAGARTEASAEESAVFRARAVAIATALKAPLAAAGVQIDESSANFSWSGESQDWVLGFKSSSGTDLRANYSAILPHTVPTSEYDRASVAAAIYVGELPMLPAQNKRPIARVAQGYDSEGNLSSCDVVAAETRVTSVTNLTTGVAVSRNMPEVILPAAAIGRFAPVPAGQW